MPQFSEFGLLANIAIFVAAAAVVWHAGFKISRYADIISSKTGVGHALLGFLLLGGVTSLPELAVTLTASIGGNPGLAVNNILGGVAMQVVILTIADFAVGRRALTSVVPDPVVLLQGSLNIVVLGLVAVAVVVGDTLLLGAGVWSWLILFSCVLSMWMLTQAEQRQPWLANIPEIKAKTKLKGVRKEPSTELRDAIGKACIAALAILAAGFVVTKTAEVIADQTQLGSSFMGAIFVAISTSLPEVSTVLSAVRLGLFTMAISDILGTNLFDVALLFIIDISSADSPVLDKVDQFSVVAALLGMLVTALFMVGLSERRDKTVFRLGIDSISVLIVYIGGVALLYSLK